MSKPKLERVQLYENIAACDGLDDCDDYDCMVSCLLMFVFIYYSSIIVFHKVHLFRGSVIRKFEHWTNCSIYVWDHLIRKILSITGLYCSLKTKNFLMKLWCRIALSSLVGQTFFLHLLHYVLFLFQSHGDNELSLIFIRHAERVDAVMGKDWVKNCFEDAGKGRPCPCFQTNYCDNTVVLADLYQGTHIKAFCMYSYIVIICYQAYHTSQQWMMRYLHTFCDIINVIIL